MRNHYLPYTVTREETTQTICLSGQDCRGELFGTGAGKTLEQAETRLRDYILDSLFAAATDGENFIGDLPTTRPDGPCLFFAAQEFFPVRLRLARASLSLTQSEVAERLGITQQAYAKLEKIGSNPKLSAVHNLEEVLQIELLDWAVAPDQVVVVMAPQEGKPWASARPLDDQEQPSKVSVSWSIQ
jgi:transcriptional regulator with XRE-family HTH domain